VIERLGRRVDLIVVPATGEAGQLGDIVRQPRCSRGQQHPAVLEQSGLRMQTHDLIGAGGIVNLSRHGMF